MKDHNFSLIMSSSGTSGNNESLNETYRYRKFKRNLAVNDIVIANSKNAVR